jgi:hypothetical protein
MKLCEDCKKEPPITGGRFCKQCKSLYISKMKSSGYLKEPPKEIHYSEQKDRSCLPASGCPNEDNYSENSTP